MSYGISSVPPIFFNRKFRGVPQPFYATSHSETCSLYYDTTKLWVLHDSRFISTELLSVVFYLAHKDCLGRSNSFERSLPQVFLCHFLAYYLFFTNCQIWNLCINIFSYPFIVASTVSFPPPISLLPSLLSTPSIY